MKLKAERDDRSFPVTKLPRQSANDEKIERLYKIVVIGEKSTGKTSIIKRYVHQYFSQHYRATIGVDFALKIVNWDANTVVRLQLWDIAGEERLNSMTRVYYKEAVGCFIVFDVSRVATFESVVRWKQDLDSKVQLEDGTPVPCVLLGNKCDQPKEDWSINTSRIDEFCKKNGFTTWFETSAKDNTNINEAVTALISHILQNEEQMSHCTDSTKIRLNRLADAEKETEKKSGCCS